MATVSVSFLKISNFNGTSVANFDNISGESITSSGSSGQSSGSAEVGHGVVRVTVAGGDVWVQVGSNPTASDADSVLLIDGDTEYFAVNVGDKVAVIDA